MAFLEGNTMSTAAVSRPGISDGACVMIASSNAEFRRRILEHIGTSFGPVTEAMGGADALAKLDESPCRYLVLDRHLADLNADELEDMLRDLYPGLEVIVLDSEGGMSDLAVMNEPEVDEALGENADGGESAAEPVMAENAAAAVTDEQAIEAMSEETPDRTGEPGIAPLPGMIGSAPGMMAVFRLARLVARDGAASGRLASARNRERRRGDMQQLKPNSALPPMKSQPPSLSSVSGSRKPPQYLSSASAKAAAFSAWRIRTARGPARNATASATSSGDPSLPSGIRASSASRCASASALVMSVSMKPGATQLTVMLRLPTSCARLLVKPISAALPAA